MKTPDGREFKDGEAGGFGSLARRAALTGLRLFGRFLVLVLKAMGKLVATTWRLAGALDAALWRGLKLGAIVLWRSGAAIWFVLGSAFQDLAEWLPSRTGRAYSAFSGIVLIVAALWIVDELRLAPAPYAGFGETRGAPVDLDDPILARIEERYVHLSEVASAALAAGAIREGETLTPKTAFERELVQSYVEQRLLAREAVDEGLHRSTTVARQLNAARDRILAAAYMERRLTTLVTDEAVERLYRAQADVTRLGDEVRARHIVVATREEAENVLRQLGRGGDFADLARAYSIDRSTAPLGGEIGYFTRDMMTPELAAAAFSTPVGATAPLFETEFGWHILEILDRRRSSGVPLEAVEDNIRRFLTLRTIETTVDQLKKARDVVYYNPDADEAPSTMEGTSGPSGGGSEE
ncbi:MAG: peptidylprolyl isomerase [Parvularculaceae bacterium]